MVPYAASKLIALDCGVSMLAAYMTMTESADFGDLRHPLDDDDNNEDDQPDEFLNIRRSFHTTLRESGLLVYYDRWEVMSTSQKEDRMPVVLTHTSLALCRY